MQMLLLLMLLCVVSFAASSEDPSCESECFTDRSPHCGVWLKKETNYNVAGAYKLHEGVLNMSCSFTSLPTPPVVSWLHRPKDSLHWQAIACSHKEEHKTCSGKEHAVESKCLLRMEQLQQTGSYRCQAASRESDSKAISSEYHVSVVGIDNVTVVAHGLPYGKLGFVEVELCANPKPELIWVTRDALLRPHEGTHRLAATHLVPSRRRAHPAAPASDIKYCYNTRLVIKQVLADDHFSLTLRNEAETTAHRLPVLVEGVPKIAASISITPLIAALTAVFL